MNEKDMSKKELEQQLSSCEVRISEIRGHERASEVSSELEGIEDQVKACRLELDEVQENVDGWAEAQAKAVKALSNMRSRVDRASKMIHVIR